MKILTAWNGLTISAFARAGRVLDRADHIQTALNAAQFLKREPGSESVYSKS